LISLVIPKLIRFHKIRPDRPYMYALFGAAAGVQHSDALSRTYGWRAFAAHVEHQGAADAPPARLTKGGFS